MEKKVKITAISDADDICTVADEKGFAINVHANQLKATNKKNQAKPGNPTEITTQGDGATVAIKEDKEEGYVSAVLSINAGGFPKDTKVQVKALDYTSKSDSENIDIILPNKKLASVKKADVKLFEAGVYNSETDIKNNPKTDENKPDKINADLDTALDGIENSIATLSELKSFIEETTSFSSETIKKCIAELTTYKETMNKEKAHSNSASVSL